MLGRLVNEKQKEGGGKANLRALGDVLDDGEAALVSRYLLILPNVINLSVASEVEEEEGEALLANAVVVVVAVGGGGGGGVVAAAVVVAPVCCRSWSCSRCRCRGR